jgi:hypothetical protein
MRLGCHQFLGNCDSIWRCRPRPDLRLISVAGSYSTSALLLE